MVLPSKIILKKILRTVKTWGLLKASKLAEITRKEYVNLTRDTACNLHAANSTRRCSDYSGEDKEELEDVRGPTKISSAKNALVMTRAIQEDFYKQEK